MSAIARKSDCDRSRLELLSSNPNATNFAGCTHHFFALQPDCGDVTADRASVVSYDEYGMEIRLSSIEAVRSEPVRYIARWEIDTEHGDLIQWSMFVKMPRESQRAWESYTEIVSQAHVQMRQVLNRLTAQVSQLQGKIR